MCVNEGWCTNYGPRKSFCPEAVELMTVKCRLHYLPQEFTVVLVTIVYISPGACANAVTQKLHGVISPLQYKHPEAFYVVTKFHLPKFYQHVTVPKQEDNTLDSVYTNTHGAHRALPHLDLSDHISLLLAPFYSL